MVEIYLCGVSTRRAQDIEDILWGTHVSPSTISNLNNKAYEKIEQWRNRSLADHRYPYVFVDGIYLKRSWGGSYENVAILVAVAVNEKGEREILGAAEGMKEDKESWLQFFQWLKERGLHGVRLIVGDKCIGLGEAAAIVFPEAKYQRCTVHFYRNILSAIPRGKMTAVAASLSAIHAQESKEAAREKAESVAKKLVDMRLAGAAKKLRDGIEETLTYYDFPREHWRLIRTNNMIERVNRELRRRARAVGTFPDGRSALMLICARLKYIAESKWEGITYMNMKRLDADLE